MMNEQPFTPEQKDFLLRYFKEARAAGIDADDEPETAKEIVQQLRDARFYRIGFWVVLTLFGFAIGWNIA